MDGQENILEAIYEDDYLENDDVEMVDMEEGEFVDGKEKNTLTDIHEPSVEHKSKNHRRRARKKKNKRKLSVSESNGMDINRFVLDTCRRLKEKKSYMVYTAVGCLGVSALSELIKEVNAIQSCGGQMTADGKRFRTGGGILWNIIKSREPETYKEIMKRAKEFEKQFKQPIIRQVSGTEKECLQEAPHMFSDQSSLELSNSSQYSNPKQDQSEPLKSVEERPSVYDRLRIPVSYDDDLLLQEDHQKVDVAILD